MPYIWVNKFVIPISTGWYQEVIDFSWRGQKSVTTDCMDKKVSNFSLLLSFYRIYYSFPCNSCVPFLLLLLRVRWNCSQGDKIASLTDGMGQNLIIDILSTELLFIYLFFPVIYALLYLSILASSYRPWLYGIWKPMSCCSI